MVRSLSCKRTTQGIFLFVILTLACICYVNPRSADERLTQELLGEWQVSSAADGTGSVWKVTLLDGGRFADRTTEETPSQLTEHWHVRQGALVHMLRNHEAPWYRRVADYIPKLRDSGYERTLNTAIVEWLSDEHDAFRISYPEPNGAETVRFFRKY